jgi:hypothetical protein
VPAAFSGLKSVVRKAAKRKGEQKGAPRVDRHLDCLRSLVQVRSFGGERRQIRVFDEQVASSRSSGERLGVAKSANESWTRIAIYVSLFVLYVVGGGEVKSVSDTWSPRRVVTYVDCIFAKTFRWGHNVSRD